MAKSPADILVVDDDRYYVSQVAAYLTDHGEYTVRRAHSVEEAMAAIKEMPFRMVVMDVRMDPGTVFDLIETAGGHMTGVVLAREIRNAIPGVKLLVHTGSTDHNLDVWYAGFPDVSILYKTGDFNALLRAVNAALNPGLHHMKAFIVHGRDRGTVLELIRFLMNMGFPEPMVLDEMPSRGLTLIEKFEHYAALADVVFVILTPDDLGVLVENQPVVRPRARQNVLFEIGYFLGMLRRKSGRIFLLHKGDVEIPSDIAGLIYIDINHGIEAAGERIRRELSRLR
jgi:predicted nucleotide-binding protein